MIKHKRTNPLHHNAGRIPNFNQNLTRHLSFVNFTCKGLMGNLNSAAVLLGSDMRDPHWKELPESERIFLAKLNARIHNLTYEIQELADDVAEFNRDKTKLDLGPTQRSKIYPPP